MALTTSSRHYLGLGHPPACHTFKYVLGSVLGLGRRRMSWPASSSARWPNGLSVTKSLWKLQRSRWIISPIHRAIALPVRDLLCVRRMGGQTFVHSSLQGRLVSARLPATVTSAFHRLLEETHLHRFIFKLLQRRNAYKGLLMVFGIFLGLPFCCRQERYSNLNCVSTKRRLDHRHSLNHLQMSSRLIGLARRILTIELHGLVCFSSFLVRLAFHSKLQLPSYSPAEILSKNIAP